MKTTFQFSTLLKSTLLAALLLPALSFGQENKYQKELDLIFQTFKTDDYKLLSPMLADDVFISEQIPVGMNDMVFPQVLAQIPPPESYTITSSEIKGDEQVVTTEYNYGNERKLRHIFTFDANRKITSFDILRDAKKVETKYGLQH
jgi:hypothetical protein